MASIHVEDHSEEVLKAKDEAVLQFLLEAGLHLETEAKQALEMDPRRVDTGLLRNSIAYALDGEPPEIQTYKADEGGETGSYSGAMPEEGQGKRAVYVGTNVEYGVYV